MVEVVNETFVGEPGELNNLFACDGDPSPNNSGGKSLFSITSPVSKRTFRKDEWPFSPVPSYRKPFAYASPCVNAVVSCGKA